MAKKSGKILIIDDNEDLLLAARLFLKKHFAVIHTEKNPQNIPALMNNEMYDVILLDMNFVRDVTHEIVNSITPIVSLASTARDLLTDEDLEEPDSFEEALDDVRDMALVQ